MYPLLLERLDTGKSHLINKHTISQVVFMGGVTEDKGAIKADSKQAWNMKCTGEPTSTKIIKELQQRQIPVIFVDKFAVYDVSFPHKFYKDLQTTGSPIANRFAKKDIGNLEGLWNKCVKDHTTSANNKTWFVERFVNFAALGWQLHELQSKVNSLNETHWHELEKSFGTILLL